MRNCILFVAICLLAATLLTIPCTRSALSPAAPPFQVTAYAWY